MPDIDSIKQHFRFVIEPEIRPTCGPIFFAGSRDDPADVINSGSYGLVDTGKRKLLVTCWHVWEGFQSDKLANPNLEMCLGVNEERLPVFSPEKPIDADEDLDIAVFDMEPYLPACSHSRFYPLHQSPPKKVERDDLLVSIGFPAHYRRPIDGGLRFGRNTFAIMVSDSNHDGSKFVSDLKDARNLPPRLNGISGCPCYIYRPQRALNLVGFATGISMDVLSITHARCIKPDGTLTKEGDAAK
jgi:hypothetical protein